MSSSVKFSPLIFVSRNLIIIVKRLQNSPINSETKNLSINDIDDILKMIDCKIGHTSNH